MPVLTSAILLCLLKGDAFDPVANLATLRSFQNEQFTAARKSNTPQASKAARDAVKQKAAELVKEVKIEDVQSQLCLPLSQLFAAAEDWKNALFSVEKFLITANGGEQFLGEQQAIVFATMGGNVDSMLSHTNSIKFSTSKQITGFVSSWFGNPFSLLTKSKTVAEAVSIADGIAEKVLSNPLLEPDDRKAVLAQLAENIADFYAEGGDQKNAIERIDSALAKLDETSNRGLKVMRARITLPGSVAPNLVFEKGYSPVKFEELKGKVVILDFFAHWCGPCKAAFPEMKEIYSKFKDKGLEMIGVTRYYGYYGAENREKRDMPKDVEFGKMEGFIKDFNITWPIMYGENSNFSNYGVQFIPYVVLIDRKGIVRKVKVGNNPSQFEAFKKEVEALVAE